MAKVTQFRFMVCILIAVLLLGGEAVSQNANDLRRIVIFKNLDLTTMRGYDIALNLVELSGSKVIDPNEEVHKLWFINALLIELPAGNITGALDYLIKSVSGILYVLAVSEDPFGCGNPLGCVNQITRSRAPKEHYDWGLERIRIPEVNLKGNDVKVAVLDTGIDNHRDLKIGPGYNAVSPAESNNPLDVHGHGTHIAGIIGATVNGVGTKGAAPQATVVAVKVLNDNGYGYLSDFLRGLQWVFKSDIRLANMSFGFNENYRALEEAIKRLREKGVIMVAAAGSCGAGDEGGGDGDPEDLCDVPETGISYPAAHPGVIAVGATNYYNQVTAYSQSGDRLDLVAPGGSNKTRIRILSTFLDGDYGYGSGTSQAAAHVTGICALALQIDPSISFEDLRGFLQATPLKDYLGRPYDEDRQGDGLIDAQKTVETVNAYR
jgi:subtilisin family serine protease